MNELSEMSSRHLLDEYKELLNAELNDHVDCSLSTLVYRNKRLGVLTEEIEKRGLKLPNVKEISYEEECKRLREDLATFRKSMKGEDR
jgi:hypothetical protein